MEIIAMDFINDHFEHGQITKDQSKKNFTFETELVAMTALELRELASDYNYLGIEFDPFSADSQDTLTKLIKKLKLTQYMNDPYQFTNVILKRLDQIEMELKKRNQ